uniref:NADH-ubiquinone oxidoreductase chain 2 n=1 Tax=Phallusia fumigata TaxID=395376 RepID=A7WL90_9ASCI|nr:NADH dehydrogenase subunit 2 [Phallusia fumigata]CAL24358.1 NADH dehydrogenase subunit 2 [Phallusia fumigata]
MGVLGLMVVGLWVVGMAYIVGGGSVFGVWVGVEFVSLVVGMGILVWGGGGFVTKSVVMMKYLMLQMVMGACLLLGLLVWGAPVGLDPLVGWMVVLVISVKMGTFPGHSWVVDVYGGVSLWEGLVLGVVPKVGLFVALTLFAWGVGMSVEWVALMSVGVGGMLGLGYTDIRHIFACSSVVTSGWLLVGMVGGGFFWIFLMYVAAMLGVVLLLEVGVHMLYKLSSSSFVGGVVGGQKSGFLVLLLLGLCGVPLSLMFLFKLTTLSLYGVGWYTAMVLLLSFFSAFMYSRLFVVSWGGASSGGLGGGDLLWGGGVWGSGGGLLVVLVSVVGVVGLLLMFFVVL